MVTGDAVCRGAAGLSRATCDQKRVLLDAGACPPTSASVASGPVEAGSGVWGIDTGHTSGRVGSCGLAQAFAKASDEATQSCPFALQTRAGSTSLGRTSAGPL